MLQGRLKSNRKQCAVKKRGEKTVKLSQLNVRSGLRFGIEAGMPTSTTARTKGVTSTGGNCRKPESVRITRVTEHVGRGRLLSLLTLKSERGVRSRSSLSTANGSRRGARQLPRDACVRQPPGSPRDAKLMNFRLLRRIFPICTTPPEREQCRDALEW